MSKYNQHYLNLIISLVGAIGFFCFAWLAMNNGHFHEDAYILFKYVENIVAGHGVSFSPDLGPAEGATDFLWLILLSILHFLGANVGLAAIILNTLGVFITLFFLNKLSDGSTIALKLALGALSLTLLLNSLTYAAAGGFSVWAYSATMIPLVYLFLSQRIELWYWVPLLSLVLGLFRPDGLIIGAVFTLAAAYVLLLRKQNIRPFIVALIIAFMFGLSYFIWRMSYFDSLLPLPLLVKAETSHVLEGWSQNKAWLLSNNALAISSLLLLFLLLGPLKRVYSSFSIRITLLTILPFVVHLCAIGFAHQSQNVGYRFQTPQLVLLYAILMFSVTQISGVGRLRLALASVLAGLIAYLSISGLANTRQHYRYLAERVYINVLPLWLNEQLPSGSLVAVTEAGRLPFWAKNYRFIDLVGLNTLEVAKDGLTLEYLQKQDPSALFIWYDTGKHDKAAVDISASTLARLNYENKERVIGKSLNTVVKASIVAADYIVQSNQYDMIAVRYWNSHNHLFAFKKGLIDTEEFKLKVEQFTQEEYDFSYLEMQSVVNDGGDFEALYVTK